MEDARAGRDDAARAFLAAFESMGFKSLNVSLEWSAGSRIYRHQGSTPDAEYYAGLEFKPRMRSFGLNVGLVNLHAMQLLKSRLPVLAKYLPPQSSSSRLLESPCWTFLSVGRALDWDLMAIPAPNNPQSWSVQLHEFEVKVLQPRILSVLDAHGIFDLLLQDDDPFVWWAAGSAILRTAQVLALGFVAGLDAAVVRSRLSPHHSSIARQIEGCRDPCSMIDEIDQALRSTH